MVSFASLMMQRKTCIERIERNSIVLLALLLVLASAGPRQLYAGELENPIEHSSDLTGDATENVPVVLEVDNSMIPSLQPGLHHAFYEIATIELNVDGFVAFVEAKPAINRNLERILFRRVISINAP